MTSDNGYNDDDGGRGGEDTAENENENAALTENENGGKIIEDSKTSDLEETENRENQPDDNTAETDNNANSAETNTEEDDRKEQSQEETDAENSDDIGDEAKTTTEAANHKGESAEHIHEHEHERKDGQGVHRHSHEHPHEHHPEVKPNRFLSLADPSRFLKHLFGKVEKLVGGIKKMFNWTPGYKSVINMFDRTMSRLRDADWRISSKSNSTVVFESHPKDHGEFTSRERYTCC